MSVYETCSFGVNVQAFPCNPGIFKALQSLTVTKSGGATPSIECPKVDVFYRF